MVKILIFMDYYLPGYKSGGPVRTISNMINALGYQFDFYVVTRNHDATEKKKYDNIVSNEWNTIGKAKVFYLADGITSLFRIYKLIKCFDFDIIYLNSFFSPRFSIFPLLLASRANKNILIASRGEFSPSAIKIKQFKKKLFISFFRKLYLRDNINWHVSSIHEKMDLHSALNVLEDNIRIARNLSVTVNDNFFNNDREISVPLKIIFISRISQMKNLTFALDVLSRVKCSVEFHIYGPIFDEKYWDKCKKLIENLPYNIHAMYCGEVFPSMIPKILFNYDLFFLPTLGENYGQIIAEALASNIPVLISNNTPWKNLEDQGVGWDIDLQDIDKFISCIEIMSRMSINDLNTMRKNIYNFSSGILCHQKDIDDNFNLFSIV